MTITIDFQLLSSGLNDRQRAAVFHTEGPLLVLAGAGTGKTKVLTTRIANIINKQLAEPQNILAVTFTNKAAKEMHERICGMIDCYGLNIGTFHSIAAKILRSHISIFASNLSTNFTIIDQDEQTKLIKDIAIISGIDIKTYTPKLLQIIIARWKDQGLLPAKVSNSDLKSDVQKIAKNIYITYQNQLIAANAVDFGDLLLYNNELFINNPDLLKYYQNKFKYILIDEYQDTNAVQYLWTRMLASNSKNICCVGDEDQSIYSWRGAEISNIMRFSRDWDNATVIKLEQNYRSSSEILAAASGLINNNKNRHDKSLWTENNTGEKIKIISCWNDLEEARFVVSETEKLMSTCGYQANQVAILVRAGFQTRAFEEALINKLLPYQIIGGVRFYERMEIRDVLAYIRITLNDNDNLALERIINIPKRAIGNITLKTIKDYATTNNISMLYAIKQMLPQQIFKNKIQENLEQLTTQITNWAQRMQNESAVTVTSSILAESGYLEMLKQEKTEESRTRIENINEMLSAIAVANNIYEFLEHASLVMSNDSLASNFGGAISVMTLHAAKGLEFEVVFLPGWEEGIFPHQKSLTEEKGLEEERRIAYVGITRAKKLLYITFAERRRMYNEILDSLPSRFLAEIAEEVCIRSSSTNQLNYLGKRSGISQSYKENKFNQLLKPPEHLLTNEQNMLRPGSKVTHIKFGTGVVIRQIDDVLEVVFANDKTIKKIKKDFLQ
ncbi:UvrD-helicase domain-containing protein [Candidatus Trichorickettsia mobilis]|uniref:UvrD-helicase domain-containing protein n=1 Tax=Candidatus Trichorickettsia mobilis TaxID=1346319 RepID=UPI0029303489|nr:UvrD-helicase domain-containing protein [Candidatus Trichorickettsia mobilis]